MSLAVAERSSTGLRLISMRPLLSVVLVPSTPMKDDRLTDVRVLEHRGGQRLPGARAMAPKEIDCGASVIAWMRPVSWTGKNPSG